MPTSIILTPTAPYDFSLALAYLHSASTAVLDQITDDTYRRALILAGQPTLLTLRSTGSVDQPQLELITTTSLSPASGDGQASFSPSPRTGEGRGEGNELVKRMFALDVDVSNFAAIAERDPIFGRLIQRYRGLRLTMMADPFEALLWTVIGQQVNIAFARRQRAALLELCGSPAVEFDGVSYPLMPSPEVVAALNPEQLRARQFNGQKASYVVGLAQAVVSGALDFATVAALPYDDALRYLIGFRGIGRWTAEYLLLRGFGARDSLPAADVGQQQAIGRAYFGRKATEAEVRQLAEQWAGWRGWAAFYWWFSLRGD